MLFRSVVDDALTVRNTLQQLVEDAGFHVKTARDGMDALDKLRTFTPRVVLTDLEMPNMNGVELTMSLRNREDTKKVPIIMIPFRGVRFLKLRFNDSDAPKDFDILTKKGPLRIHKQAQFLGNTKNPGRQSLSGYFRF